MVGQSLSDYNIREIVSRHWTIPILTRTGSSRLRSSNLRCCALTLKISLRLIYNYLCIASDFPDFSTMGQASSRAAKPVSASIPFPKHAPPDTLPSSSLPQLDLTKINNLITTKYAQKPSLSTLIEKDKQKHENMHKFKSVYFNDGKVDAANLSVTWK